MEVDRHRPPSARRASCPIARSCTRQLSGYPFAELCGAAVAWKLGCALREAAGARPPPPEDLDLVALATVADVVPLVGENRSLVRRGLEEMRRAKRAGLRALLAASYCEPTRLDEGDLAFRLGAADQRRGAALRADAGVELFLTDDEERAKEIAAELDRANSRAARDRAQGRRRRRGGAPRAAGASCGKRRGLVLAGGGLAPRGDRDRRLAARRAPPPAGGRGLARRGGGRSRLGAQHPRLRPSARR